MCFKFLSVSKISFLFLTLYLLFNCDGRITTLLASPYKTSSKSKGVIISERGRKKYSIL